MESGRRRLRRGRTAEFDAADRYQSGYTEEISPDRYALGHSSIEHPLKFRHNWVNPGETRASFGVGRRQKRWRSAT